MSADTIDYRPPTIMIVESSQSMSQVYASH
jgi:hypothetical protein